MMTSEPILAVGILDGVPEVRGVLHGSFRTDSGVSLAGPFTARATGESVTLSLAGGDLLAGGRELRLLPVGEARAEILNVTIGIQFHWERTEAQTFQGALRFKAKAAGTLTLINDIALEQYLTSVISSEMSAESSLEFLRAHAISLAQLARRDLDRRDDLAAYRKAGRIETPELIVRWYDREDHDSFDVCADDHCQRYQGISRTTTTEAVAAVEDTRGMVLTWQGEVCDARFSKSCGGMTERFSSAWGDLDVDYQAAFADHDRPADFALPLAGPATVFDIASLGAIIAPTVPAPGW